MEAPALCSLLPSSPWPQLREAADGGPSPAPCVTGRGTPATSLPSPLCLSFPKAHYPPQRYPRGCTRVGALARHPGPTPDPTPRALEVGVPVLIPPGPPQGPDQTRVPVDLLIGQLAPGSPSQALTWEQLKFQNVCQEISCL